MSRLRKRWMLRYVGEPDAVDMFPSERKTYEFIGALGRAYAQRPDTMARHVHVWVDERDGRGWVSYEHIDLAELGGAS